MAYGELAGNTAMGGYFRFNGDANDYSGNSRNLTTTGTAAYAAGKIGSGALYLPASTNPYPAGTASVYRADNMGIAGGATTHSAWIKNYSNPGTGETRAITYVYNSSSSYVGYQIVYYNNGSAKQVIFRRFKNPGTYNDITYNFTIPNEWTLLTLVYDNTYLYGYHNAKLVAGPSAFSGNGTAGRTNACTIGVFSADLVSFGYQMNADFDEVIIDGRAWSAAEIRRYYAFTVGRMGPQSV